MNFWSIFRSCLRRSLPVGPLLAVASSLCAQNSAVPAVPNAAVVEIPTLVTDHEHRPVGDFRAEQFVVKVGSGKPIAPLTVRKEGTDLLSLVILLDASRDSFHDLSEIGDDLASLVGGAMDPHTRISIYSFDCAMVKTLNNAAPDADALRKAVQDGLQYPTVHGGKQSSSCGKTVHLWDDVSVAVAALSHMPGRRVILLVSPGTDGGSKYDWQTVQQYAREQSVAIFGLRDQRQADADTFSRNSLSTSSSMGTRTMNPTPAARDASAIELFCANAGGLTLSSTTLFRKDALADILFLIGSRIILTVPKDSFLTIPSQNFKVSLTGGKPFYVTATGPSEPLPPTP